VTLSLGDPHSLLGSRSDEVGFELGDHRQDVEQQPADRVGGVVHRCAETESHLALGQILSDRPSIGQRAGKPVQFGDDQRVTGAAGG
jgi:hypothetical protein